MQVQKIRTEDVARKFIDAYNSHDLTAIAATLAPDVEMRSPATPIYAPQGVKGKQAVSAAFDMALKSTPDAHDTLSTIIASGRTVAFELVETGTLKGPIQLPTRTIPPTNRRYKFFWAGFLTVNEEGLITKMNFHYDVLGWLRQVGVKPE